MLNAIPYLIYFSGPFLLAYFLGRRLLRANYGAFVAGLLAFFGAWVCIIIVIQISAAQSVIIKEGTFLYALIVSASAGLFEESSRFFTFRLFKGLQERKNWNTGIMYAIGYSGMESIVVGASLLLSASALKHVPELLPLRLLDVSGEVLKISFHQGLYNSLERLLVGLLIHSCFTFVVLLSLIKSQKKYLWFAMVWHFGHDMVGFNLHCLSAHWIVEKFWILFIVVVYSWILVHLLRKIVKETS